MAARLMTEVGIKTATKMAVSIEVICASTAYFAIAKIRPSRKTDRNRRKDSRIKARDFPAARERFTPGTSFMVFQSNNRIPAAWASTAITQENTRSCVA